MVTFICLTYMAIYINSRVLDINSCYLHYHCMCINEYILRKKNVVGNQCSHGIEVLNKLRKSLAIKNSSQATRMTVFIPKKKGMPVVWATLCLFLFVIHFSFEFCRSSSKKYRVFFKLASNLRNQKKERWFRFKIRERLRLFPHHMMLFPYLVSQLLLKQAMAAFSQDKSQSILFQIQLINTNSKG